MKLQFIYSPYASGMASLLVAWRALLILMVPPGYLGTVSLRRQNSYLRYHSLSKFQYLVNAYFVVNGSKWVPLKFHTKCCAPHRKICILPISIFCVWFTISLNCEVIACVRRTPGYIWLVSCFKSTEELYYFCNCRLFVQFRTLNLHNTHFLNGFCCFDCCVEEFWYLSLFELLYFWI